MGRTNASRPSACEYIRIACAKLENDILKYNQIYASGVAYRLEAYMFSLSENSFEHGDLTPEELLPLVVEGIPGMVAYVNSRYQYVFVNERYAAWYGLTKKQITGKFIHEILTETAAYQRAKVHYDRALSGERVAFINEVHRNGERRYVSVEFVPRFGHDGSVKGFFALLQDITHWKETETELLELNERLREQLAEIERLQQKLREQAIRDALTGLFNRRYLEETLVREVARADRERLPLSVVMLDIDYFKKVNDTYGHKAGDHLLHKWGSLLLNTTRKGDIACRYGGEEFVLVLPGSPIEMAVQRAEDWRAAFRMARTELGLSSAPVTLSAGVATYPIHGDNAEALLDAADQALYTAKALGRNRVVVYRSETT